MGEVVDLVWEDAVSDHLGVIDAGGGFLLPCGVVPAFEVAVDVTGHVPHVGDAGGGGTAHGGGGEGLFGAFVVPEVDEIVVDRVEGIFCEDLLGEGVGGEVAGAFDAVAVLVAPDEADGHGAGLEVVGVVHGDAFHVFDEVAGGVLALVVVLLFAEEFPGAFEPCFFARGGGFEGVVGDFGDEFAGAFFVFEIGHGHAPVAHEAGGVELEDGAERAFGFPVPEAVKLGDALIEIGGDFRVGGSDWEGDVAAAWEEREAAARAFVEAVAVDGVARGSVCGERGIRLRQSVLGAAGEGESEEEGARRVT